MLGQDCDVAVVGAGPFGLAAAAHLKAAGLSVRAFGKPMDFWRRNMPRGMVLRTPATATEISEPRHRHTLSAYLRASAAPAATYLPLERYTAYGRWFQEQAVGDLDARLVATVSRAKHGFRLVLDDGVEVGAARVVVATGLARQDRRPDVFADVPGALVSHSSEHSRLDIFRARRIAVVGRGQSAIESAVLLAETGAEVTLLARGPVSWRTGHGRPLGALSDSPTLFQVLPASLRDRANRIGRGADAAKSLRPRTADLRIAEGVEITQAAARSGGVELALSNGAGMRFDHVLLATGYRIDIARLGLLAPELLGAIATRDGSPILRSGFQTSVAGLHFVGASAVESFGPTMGLVRGTGYAARAVAAAALAGRAKAQGDVRATEGERDLIAGARAN